MSKRLILILVVIYFFSYFNLAWADVVISEVKISPTEDRFIKLYNQDSVAVDLTNWYIQRKTQTGSSFISLVSKTNFENKSIGANGYFLISRSPIENYDIVLGDLTLTESNAIQIKNGNGEVVDKVCWGDISDCGGSNLSNPVSGQSIQIVNSVPISDVTTTLNTTLVSEPIIPLEVKTKIIEEPKIKTKVTVKTFGFVGLPLSFQATTLGYGGEQLHSGKYFWNFGDADSMEVKLSDNQPFSHTYFYPGDYAVSLDYFQNYYSDIPDTSDQIIIKIVPADIVISRVGDEKDFFIELTNNTIYDVDISNWVISSDQKSFTIPRNTILASKKKMIISPKISNFSILDKDTLKLMVPGGEVVFSYVSALIPITSVKVTSNLIPQRQSLQKISKVLSPTSNVELITTPDNLLASAISSNPTSGNKNNFYAMIIFVVFILISAYAVYFIRQKKIIPSSGDDFEILDE